LPEFHGKNNMEIYLRKRTRHNRIDCNGQTTFVERQVYESIM
jgi:hypothetical protein